MSAYLLRKGFTLSLISVAIAAMTACGGGGSDSSVGTTTPTSTTSTTTTPATTGTTSTTTPASTTTTTTSGVPTLAAQPIDLGAISSLGTATWADGTTSSGGQGQAFGTDICVAGMAETYHVHTHLAIIKDGTMLQIPKDIGILSNCLYLTHTHDARGVLHVEADSYRLLTLGQFFNVWGQPLTATNVAGFSGQPIRLYLNDGASLQEIPSTDWASLELKGHRSITIVIGSVPATIPTYTWPAGL